MKTEKIKWHQSQSSKQKKERIWKIGNKSNEIKLNRQTFNLKKYTRARSHSFEQLMNEKTTKRGKNKCKGEREGREKERAEMEKKIRNKNGKMREEEEKKNRQWRTKDQHEGQQQPKSNEQKPLHPRAAVLPTECAASVVGQSQRRHDGSAPKARQRDAIIAVSPGSSRAGLTVTNCG